MTQITFCNTDQPHQIILEVLEFSTDCRIIIFGRDEDTGARSVRDIIQCDDRNLAAELETQAVHYEINILTDLKLPFDPNLGRASTLKGWCKKIQVHVEAGRRTG